MDIVNFSAVFFVTSKQHYLQPYKNIIYQKVFKKMSTEFSLSGKGLKLDSAEDINPYIDELLKIKGLTKVNVKGNTFGIEASKALGSALKNQSDLEYIDLSDMFTGRLREEIPESLDAILSSLLTCEKLHTIDLSDNAFGIMTIDPLEKFLSQHTPLEHLILANNGLGPAAGTRVANALSQLSVAKKASSHPTKLLTVICGRNRLENGSMEAWANFLAAHGTIRDLRLPQNGIRPEGIEHLLIHGLSKSSAIERLDLQDNTFTEKGAQALAKVLSKWPKISDLGISDCLLSAKGGELLGEALSVLKPLENFEHLRLQYNEIEISGAEKLYNAIKLNIPNLKVLELNGNKFPEDHEIVQTFNELFEERGFGELDELDDMELDSDDELSSEDEEEEFEKLKETILKDADLEENSSVAGEDSSSIDKLAADLNKAL